jgi:hypothetical protein
VEIRVFVNCCLARDRVVYGVALVQPWCNKIGKHHKVVVLTAELAENCLDLSSKERITGDKK